MTITHDEHGTRYGWSMLDLLNGDYPPIPDDMPEDAIFYARFKRALTDAEELALFQSLGKTYPGCVVMMRGLSVAVTPSTRVIYIDTRTTTVTPAP